MRDSRDLVTRRPIPEPDKRDAVALFREPAVETGRRQLWSTEGPLDLDGKDLWASRDAEGLRFAFTTEIAPLDIDLPNVMISGVRRPRVQLRIDEWVRQYVGPRPGLTPSENEAAHRETITAWLTQRETEMVGGQEWWTAGIVPVNWAQGFRDVYARLTNPTLTVLAPRELGVVEGGLLVWRELRPMLVTLRG